MNQETPKNKVGRPRKVIDLAKVEALATIGCTHAEIAVVLGVSIDTLTRNKSFADLYKKGETGGKISLRHHMMQLAAKGNAIICIFLAKNRLGMKEVVVTEHAGELTVNDRAKELLVSKLAAKPVSAEPDREGSQLVN